MTTQILFDDKTLMTFVTPDKILHRFYPGIVKTEIPSYRMWHQEEARDNVLVGETTVIPVDAHVLCYEPCYTGERSITVMGGRTRHIFFLNNKVLSYVKFAKFISMVVDEYTWDAILHFWVNVNADSKGELGIPYADDSGEPFNRTNGNTDTTMMRALAFSRGHYYGVFDNKDGSIKWMPTYIFESPQIVEVVGVWNPDNEAEQVLDIHNELNEH